jgi:hypothetical protein
LTPEEVKKQIEALKNRLEGSDRQGEFNDQAIR